VYLIMTLRLGESPGCMVTAGFIEGCAEGAEITYIVSVGR